MLQLTTSAIKGDFLIGACSRAYYPEDNHKVDDE